MTRKFMNLAVGMAEEGMISWESLARSCLDSMSEDDVRDMLEMDILDAMIPDDLDMEEE